MSIYLYLSYPWQFHFVVYGEWCGNHINHGAVICQIDMRVFAVFAVLDVPSNTLIVEPKRLEEILLGKKGSNSISTGSSGSINVPKAIRVLPWMTEEIQIDFGSNSSTNSNSNSNGNSSSSNSNSDSNSSNTKSNQETETEGTLRWMNELVDRVDKEDPWYVVLSPSLYPSYISIL